MTMITPSYLGETIEYSSLHACRSTLEDPTGVEPSGDIDRRQFPVFPLIVFGEFPAFPGQVSLFRVGLGMYRNVFTRSHRHRAGHQTSHPGHQNVAMTGVGRRDAKHQARRRQDSIVGPQHGRAQPSDSCCSVILAVME